ncbi:alpha-keto acid decarboxylase family protein [bacterium]|nr:alpha-keto acid decarboxylase family protein [bacterium]
MSDITVIDYLVCQLSELGITDVFGLPGDYNFNIVEAIEKNENTSWIGCTNELNAGYAADGYARVKGYGAIVTTYGVGELSAINAIAGSYAEYVPVVKIVGVPSCQNIEKNALLHHNFSTPNYYAFEKAYSNVVETTAYLNVDNAKSEIDRVLSILVSKKRPVYIAIPDDVCNLRIENNPNITKQKSDKDTLSCAVGHILSLLSKSEKPVVLADVLVERFEAKDEFFRFLETSKYPVTTLLMGKGLIDWDYKGYIGTYLGKHDNKTTYEYVNNSDCVITVGAIYSDLNTFGFDYKFNPSSMIDIEGTYTIVENIVYENILMKDVLFELSKLVPQKCFEYPIRTQSFLTPEVSADEKLTSDFIYPKIQEFIKEDDIIFSETGLVEFGFAPMKLPKGANLFNQVLWGSIGWATPACFGAAIAAKNKRIILMTGEGSHQLTAQEVSSMLRYGVKPIIIILNNAGYTIERILSKDPMDNFNEISSWNYSKLPSVFNGDAYVCQARTNKEFHQALQIAELEQETKLCYIEIFTDKMDLPKLAKSLVKNKIVL